MIDGADCFLDTNILLYAAMGRFDAPDKHEQAQALLPLKFGVSGQVLSEFYVNATRKGSVPLSEEEALEWIAALAKKPFQPVDVSLVRAAIGASRRHQISYWDGAIVAAAERLGARTLFTEDLNHGQDYGSVTAINPFL